MKPNFFRYKHMESVAPPHFFSHGTVFLNRIPLVFQHFFSTDSSLMPVAPARARKMTSEES